MGLPILEFDASISIGDIVNTVYGTVGLFGLFLAFGQLRLSQKANRENARSTRARFVLDLNQWFTEDKDEKAFFYRLDYSSHENSFKFEEKNFPHSEDEIFLDTLLYKLAHVGDLLRSGVISVDDLGWARFFVQAVLENTEVHAYLLWLKTPKQVPDHSGFLGAIFLYEELIGTSTNAYSKLRVYLGT